MEAHHVTTGNPSWTTTDSASPTSPSTSVTRAECDSKTKSIPVTGGESMNLPVSSIGSLMGESEASREERVMASREAVTLSLPLSLPLS